MRRVFFNTSLFKRILMSSFSNILTSLELQFNPTTIIILLLGLVALFGLVLGVCSMAIVSIKRRHKMMQKLIDERNLLEQLLEESRLQSARLQSERDEFELDLQLQQTETDSTAAQHGALVAHVSSQDDRIMKLAAELEAAESLSRARQRELLSRRAPEEDAELPTLNKRVLGSNHSSQSEHDTGIIPDDQLIPTLPEAELTANVDAYDLSDLEDLVGQEH